MLFMFGFLTAWFTISAIILALDYFNNSILSITAASKCELFIMVVLTFPAFAPAFLVKFIVFVSKNLIRRINNSFDSNKLKKSNNGKKDVI